MSAPVNSSLPEIDGLWNHADAAASEKALRDVLPRAEASGDASYLAVLLTQIARAEGLQRRFADAHATLDRAERLIRPDMALARVRLLLERGRAVNGIPGVTAPSAEDRARARALFVEAWEAGRAARLDRHAIDAAHMLAIIEPPEAAIEWTERGIAAAEASSDERARGWLGPLRNNLGWTYHDRGEYAKALALFEADASFRAGRGRVEEARVARWSAARALRSLGRSAEALERQQALAAEWEQAGGKDGFVFEELAECLLALGRAAEARPWFARAHAELSKDEWLAKSEPARLARLKEMAGSAAAAPGR